MLEPFEPQDKIFCVQKESEEWGDKLDVATVGDLNDRITREGVQSLMLIQEHSMRPRFLRLPRRSGEGAM